jgi:2-polyprenyl-3-methyl-5-hydroxy-6-metoxy-1,4-benzoquinol methylase
LTAPSLALAAGLDARARQSLGTSHAAIYEQVASALDRHGVHGGRAVDVGCGAGSLFGVIGTRFASYTGLDAVRYAALPAAVTFHQVDLDQAAWSVLPAPADAVLAIETIEHLENPWAFMRRLFALTAPGGLVIVTTPNQLSLLSLLTLIVKRRFSAFQDAHYPAHCTALLESDLVRAAEACGLEVTEVAYTGYGRLPFAAWHYPTAIARLAPRWLSDNLMVVARRPRA